MPTRLRLFRKLLPLALLTSAEMTCAQQVQSGNTYNQPPLTTSRQGTYSSASNPQQGNPESENLLDRSVDAEVQGIATLPLDSGQPVTRGMDSSGARQTSRTLDAGALTSWGPRRSHFEQSIIPAEPVSSDPEPAAPSLVPLTLTPEKAQGDLPLQSGGYASLHSKLSQAHTRKLEHEKQLQQLKLQKVQNESCRQQHIGAAEFRLRAKSGKLRSVGRHTASENSHQQSRLPSP